MFVCVCVLQRSRLDGGGGCPAKRGCGDGAGAVGVAFKRAAEPISQGQTLSGPAMGRRSPWLRSEFSENSQAHQDRRRILALKVLVLGS